MRPFRLSPAVALALLAACASPRLPAPPVVYDSTFDATTTAALSAVLVRERDEQQIPALWVRLERPDGAVFRAAVGTRDPDRRQPAALADCVRVGSVTKLVVAVAAMRLVERGVLRLEDPLARWAPGVPNAGAITIERLLRHQAGLPDVLGAGSAAYATFFTDHDYSRRELLAKISARPMFAPGSRVAYSNGNAVALGIALEEAAGAPIRSILKEQVSAPAGAANRRPRALRD